MKTSTITKFFNAVGITTETLDANKGLIELPYLSDTLIAVSENEVAQLQATDKFREISSKNKTSVISCTPLTTPHASTIIPGVGCRVPVFTFYTGRFEDTHSTQGHLVTNSRLMVLSKEYAEFSKNKSSKTPYLSWLCKAMGVTRPRTLAELQDVIIEASKQDGHEAVPAITELTVGRGTRHAVMTVGSNVQYNDTEPTVNESDWRFIDLERLVLGGITETQASVLRKTAEAFKTATLHEPVAQATLTVNQRKSAALDLLAA
jgi:hypothetical protein